MNYKALSPWGLMPENKTRALNPRLSDLNGKTIGLYAHFKWSAPLFNKEIEKVIKEKYPEARFSYFQYTKDTKELANDLDTLEAFKEWLSGVDTVIGSYADAGSCAMFLAYNMAFAEKLGKSALLITKKDMVPAAKRGAGARMVPGLRMVTCDMQDITVLPPVELYGTDEEVAARMIAPQVRKIADEIIDAVVRPLDPEETLETTLDVSASFETIEGSLEDINNLFYKRGYTMGNPIIPPTEEKVSQMLKGTDLPRDYVVAQIPPMRGQATVEKIAINAVMAGCLPAYMPVLIAAVKAICDPAIHLEGWTCSVAGWGMMFVVSGRVAKDIGLSGGANYLSEYKKASATVSRAINYILMNIGGIRPQAEDMSHTGHENKFGVVFTEREDSPFPSVADDFGMGDKDCAVTVFWYKQAYSLGGVTIKSILDSMISAGSGNKGGFGGGFIYVIPPLAAKALAGEGWTKKRIVEYISEYARQSAQGINYRLLIGNNHLPKNAMMPLDPNYSIRRFMTTMGMHVLVCGSDTSPYGYGFDAVGCHGGPACASADLPKDWDELCRQCDELKQDIVRY